MLTSIREQRHKGSQVDIISRCIIRPVGNNRPPDLESFRLYIRFAYPFTHRRNKGSGEENRVWKDDPCNIAIYQNPNFAEGTLAVRCIRRNIRQIFIWQIKIPKLILIVATCLYFHKRRDGISWKHECGLLG